MADELRLTITLPTTVSGALVPVLQTTGSYYLRVSPFSSNTATGTHIATGSWSFGTVQDGVYELWNATEKIASFGRKYISDNEPDFANVYTSGKVYTNEIAEYTSASGVTIDGTIIKDGIVKADTITEKTTNAGVTIETVLLKDGKGTFIGLDTNINTSGSGDTKRPKAVYSDGYLAATLDAEFVEKKYVDDLYSTLAVSPYQESSQYRRVITDGVTETGKVYTTIASAISSLSPTSAKRCAVEITSTGTSGKILLNHSNVTDYVDIIGKRKFNLILGGTGSTLSKAMTFKNLNIYMGNYDIVGARTYTNITFEDCDIYSFQNLTFTNCIFKNCMIYQGSGHTVTFTGSCEIVNTPSTQSYLGLTEITGFITISSQHEVLTSYSMPADPTDTGS